MQQAQKIAQLGGSFGFLLGALFTLDQCRFTVKPGQAALIFNRIGGLSDYVYREGWHFRLPYFQKPIIYDVTTQVFTLPASTANKDMQNVNLKLRVLFKPNLDTLPDLYSNVGMNYDERVLPSIINEVLRSVVAQYSASHLMSQREQVSTKIRRSLETRAAQFYINIEDVSIADMSFGKEYQTAVESKQIAQQEAERAKYIVEQARDQKKSIIIKAKAEARSIQLVGEAAMAYPTFLEVRRIEYSKQIAQILANSRNHIMLNSDILQMDTGKSGSASQQKK